MSSKKWFVMLFAALLSTFICWAGFNILVDPFGVFGGGLRPWDSYAQTLNPRNSKVVYISDHFDDFDSYIIGSSSAASYLPETLEKYMGGSFYNMFHYGSDIDYDEELVDYLLENDDVKNIVLVVGINEVLSPHSLNDTLTDKLHYQITGENRISYYLSFLFANPSYSAEKIQHLRNDTEMPQAFDCFCADTGCYDKRLRDVEPIGSLEDYLHLHSSDFEPHDYVTSLKYTDGCISAISHIRDSCEKFGADLTVICTPVYKTQLDTIDEESLIRFHNELSECIEYWDFSISPVSQDARYFYDDTHTRNALADMVITRIFDGTLAYYPDSFGPFISPDTEKNHIQQIESVLVPNSSTVPTLLYHHISDDTPENDIAISSEHFRTDMELLRRNNYNPISIYQLRDYVYYGTKLPDNPIMITFDDGYFSNYELAFPILKEYNYPATIFVIGCSVGHDRYYKDTQYELTPHFGKPEIEEMLSSGLIAIQSHTYDMHQWEPFESAEPVRSSIVRFADESEEDYIIALTCDIIKQKDLLAENGVNDNIALAFPCGAWETLTNTVLVSKGYQITFTTDSERVNTVVCGLPQSLINIGRYSVSGETTQEELLSYLSARDE